jgi:hypothetical protein
MEKQTTGEVSQKFVVVLEPVSQEDDSHFGRGRQREM